MPAKWTSITERTTGISAATVNASAGVLGSEIDNETNRDQYAIAELVFTPNAAAAENEVIELFLVTDPSGSNYEDGGTSTRPKSLPVPLATRDSGSAERIVSAPFLLPPTKFKPELWNAMSGQATSVTLKLWTFNTDPAA